MKRPHPPLWFSYSVLAVIALGVLVVGVGRTIEGNTPASQITYTVPNTPHTSTKNLAPPKIHHTAHPAGYPVYTAEPSPPLQVTPNTGYATPAPSPSFTRPASNSTSATPTPTTTATATATASPSPSLPTTPAPGSGSPSPSNTSIPQGYSSGDPIPTNTGFQSGDKG